MHDYSKSNSTLIAPAPYFVIGFTDYWKTILTLSVYTAEDLFLRSTGYDPLLVTYYVLNFPIEFTLSAWIVYVCPLLVSGYVVFCPPNLDTFVIYMYITFK